MRLALLLAAALAVPAGPIRAAGPCASARCKALATLAPELSPKVLALALTAAAHERRLGLHAKPVLAVIDYTLPSKRRRLWVFDLAHRRLLFHELVAHGRGSGDGEGHATRFSNRDGSLASSVGLYETGGTYEGKHGLSLKLRGLEKGFNDHALARRIVIHGAWYVSAAFARAHGRLGRSWGCPAVRKGVVTRLVEALRGGGLVFVYGRDRAWLAHSRLLH